MGIIEVLAVLTVVILTIFGLWDVISEKCKERKYQIEKKKQAKKQWEACKDQLVKVSASIKLMDGEQLCLVREFRAKYHPDHYVYTAESRADAYYRNGSSDIITKGVVIDGVHYSPNSIKSVTMTFA